MFLKLFCSLLVLFSTKSFLIREETDDDGSFATGKSPCHGGRYMQENDDGDNPNTREPCGGRYVQEVIFMDIEEEKGNNLLPSGRYNFGMTELPYLMPFTSYLNHHLEQDTFTCNPVPDARWLTFVTHSLNPPTFSTVNLPYPTNPCSHSILVHPPSPSASGEPTKGKTLLLPITPPTTSLSHRLHGN